MHHTSLYTQTHFQTRPSNPPLSLHKKHINRVVVRQLLLLPIHHIAHAMVGLVWSRHRCRQVVTWSSLAAGPTETLVRSASPISGSLLPLWSCTRSFGASQAAHASSCRALPRSGGPPYLLPPSRDRLGRPWRRHRLHPPLRVARPLASSSVWSSSAGSFLLPGEVAPRARSRGRSRARPPGRPRGRGRRSGGRIRTRRRLGRSARSGRASGSRSGWHPAGAA
mmetsp:Transcript_17872/g.44672  ORF Transcript_17872/g.44672 Transcript_17872/m.44672 type:complete len:223 (+) Transcript_17872:167-835(+)